NQVGQQRHPDAKRNRNRQLLDDKAKHAFGPEVAVAEIEGQIVPHHDQEALVRRLVESELLLKLLDELRIEALSTTIAGAALLAGLNIGGLLARHVGLTASNTCGSGDIRAGKLGDDALDGSARGK